MPANNAPQPNPSGRVSRPSGAIGLLVGFTIGALLGGSIAYAVAYDQGRVAEKAELLRLVEESGVYGDPESNVRTVEISGLVQSVDGDVLTVEVAQTVKNPLAPPAPTVRKIRMTATTVATLREQKSEEAYAIDLAAHAKALAALRAEATAGEEDSVTLPLPSRTLERTITASDIIPGHIVRVIAATDISYEEAFDAVEILVGSEPTEEPTEEPTVIE